MHGLSLQTGCRKSLSTGSLWVTSLQGPSLQMGRRRSDSAALSPFSFSFAAGTSPMREEGTIFPLPGIFGSGLRRSEVVPDDGAAACDADDSEFDDAGALETWLPMELELLNDGVLDGEGPLGSL